MTYTFLLVSSSGATPVFECVSCPDNLTAPREALAIRSRSPERRAVEVWDERERLCVVEREAPTAH